MQVGASGFAEKDFKEYVADAAADPVGRVFGGGDYTDGISPSNRKLFQAAYTKGDLYDTFAEMLKAGSDEQVDYFINLVAPLTGKVDFWLKGHHLFEYVERVGGQHRITWSDQRIADTIGGKYFGEPGTAMGTALVTYRFPSARAGLPRPELRLYAMHGQGSGNSFASPLNSLEKQMRAHTADIYFTAHHHKLVAGAGVRLFADDSAETKLRGQNSRLVAGGSWLKGFLLNDTTYAEDGSMVPLALGAPIIHIKRRDDNSFKITTEV